MVYKWSDLVGQSVANLYVIRAVHAEQPDRAAFEASTIDGEVPILLELLVPESPDFEDQRRCWQIAADIRHANLVRILGTGEAAVDGVPMLYCAKERHDDELASVLDSRPLTEAETREVLGGILPCLDHIHREHCVHGSMSSSAVLAFDDRVKLAPDTIRPIGPTQSTSDDIHAVGLLIMEMLAGRRGAAPHLEEISAPLRDVVAASTDSKRRQSLTPAALMTMLSPAKEVPRPAPVPERIQSVPVVADPPPDRTRRRAVPIAAGVIAATLLIAALMQWRRAPQPAPPVAVNQAPTQEEIRPSPVTPAAEPAPAPAPPKPTPAARTVEPGSWAVIAATYRSFDAAQKRAEALRRQWKRCDCSVYPNEGEGRVYYVIVGAGLNKNAAERLHASARSSLPSDTYVTRLQDGGTRARQSR